MIQFEGVIERGSQCSHESNIIKIVNVHDKRRLSNNKKDNQRNRSLQLKELFTDSYNTPNNLNNNY